MLLARKHYDISHTQLCWLVYDFAEKIAVDGTFNWAIFFYFHCLSAYFGCPKDQDFLSKTVPGKREYLFVHTGLTTGHVMTVNVEYLKYLCRPIPNVATRTRQNKSRIIIAKASFNMKTTLVTSTLDLNLRKKLVKLEHCRNLDASKSSSEIPWKFKNLVLEKDEEDHSDLSCKKMKKYYKT